ncbi:unnamed protein product, partial [Rotaria sp. Silwood2]
VNATLFSVAAKSIIWIDGKGIIKDISQLLKEARAPVIDAHHPDLGRTSASEVNPTISRMHMRERSSSRLTNYLMDIEIQKNEYQRDRFYSRSDALNLKMYDIAIFLYQR